MAAMIDSSILITIVTVTSIVSLVATGLLFITFCSFKRLRSPSNILLFLASIANFIVNIACLAKIGNRINPDEASCQAQAFLVQWLMDADPWWSCAMAFNLYLCVCRNFTIGELKRLYWAYTLFCYGVPLIPAVFCLFYQDQRGKVFGNSVLWCWIKIEYVDIRIWTTYMPIWFAILLTLAFYSRIGFVIYRLHREIKSIYDSTRDSTGSEATMIRSGPHELFPALSYTSEFPEPSPQGEEANVDTTTGEINYYRTSRVDSIDTLMISGIATSSGLQNTLALPEKESGVGGTEVPVVAQQFSSPSSKQTHTAQTSQSSAAAVMSSPTALAAFSSQQRINRLRAAFAKPALLFSCSILITWIPPTINRAQSLKSPGIPPPPSLLVVQAIVLPLQGFWNSLIYFVISWSVIQNIWKEWKKQR